MWYFYGQQLCKILIEALSSLLKYKNRWVQFFPIRLDATLFNAMISSVPHLIEGLKLERLTLNLICRFDVACFSS